MHRAAGRAGSGSWTGLSAALLAAITCIGIGPSAAQSAYTLANDTRNTEIVTTNTPMPLPDFGSRTAWEARKTFLRNQILVSAGLSPMPQKTPLHPQISSKIDGPGYTIEKVLLEPLPGFYLGGNLYRPADGKPKHPAILAPQGDWENGTLENDPASSAFGIGLARQGYVVFTYDSTQLPHCFGNATGRLWSFSPLGLQLWNSIRALDFLASLDDVNPSRIGIAGSSGEATQALLLAAIDDRIQFESSAAIVSSTTQNGDVCENSPGLRINTSNVEIAAMFAPRPMLLVSGATDATRTISRDDYPAIQHIYDLYGKADQVSLAQSDAEHSQQSRDAVYKFFAHVNPGLSNDNQLTSHSIEVPTPEQTKSLPNHSLPTNAVDLTALFHEWRAMAEAQNQQPQREIFLRERLRQTLAIEVPDNVISQTAAQSVNKQSMVLNLPGWRDRLQGIELPGTGALAIVVDPDGSAAALQSSTVKHLRQQGRAIFALDVFQTGAAKVPRDRQDTPPAPSSDATNDSPLEQKAAIETGGPQFLAFNVTDDEGRVQDIVTAIAYAYSSGRDVEVYAHGDAALWATFAAAVTRVPVSLHLENVPKLVSDDDYLTHFDVPGILRAGGLPVAQHLANAH
jgi:dienelactone hydrolase